MTPPVTPWETDKRWTTADEETLILEQIATETGAEHHIFGLSVEGRPMHAMSLGQGHTMMVVANVHAREPTPREALLIWFRDLAYSTNPEDLAFLQDHRVVIMPDMCPDSIAPFRRNNSNNVNLNRDYPLLTQPETRALRRAVNHFQPSILIDGHEVGSNGGYQWRYWGEQPPGTSQGLADHGADAAAFMADHLASEGITSRIYDHLLKPWSMLGFTAQAFHAAGILSEPPSDNSETFSDRDDRMRTGAEILASFRDYFVLHAADLTAARQQSIAESESGAREIVVPFEDAPSREGGEHVFIPAYTALPVGDVPTEILDLHEIQHADGMVSLAQKSGVIAAWILHPDSFYYHAGARWDPDYDDHPQPEGPAMRFGWATYQGVRHPIHQVWAKRDGVRRKVTDVWSKQQGILAKVRG